MVFEYVPSYLSSGLELAPIHLPLEDAQAGTVFSFPNIDKWTFSGLPGLLAGSLPDSFGNRVLDVWLARQGRTPQSFNPVERLCYIGTRGMGALEYEPVLAPREHESAVAVEIRHLMELANDALLTKKELKTRVTDDEKQTAEAMRDILRVGVSAGGMVPKAIIAIDEEGHVISGQADIPEGYSHWIIKFDGMNQDEHGRFGRSRDDCRVEYAYSLMAAAAGITMTECRLLEENGRVHFLTKRFDRLHNEKLHVLSLAAIAHLGWNPPGAVGYESAFQVMRVLRLPYPEQEQMFKRMVFNAVTRNVDDHVKNISFTMNKSGEWQLSPAYDLTFSVNELDPLGEFHKMTINGRQDDFSFRDFKELADNMGIKHPGRIVSEILDVTKQWPEFGKEARVAQSVINHIEEHLLDHAALAA